MTRRGLTMIELLVSLALLGLLSLMLSTWIQLTARAAASASSTLPWERAAAMTLQRIGEDLLIGDWSTQTGGKPQDSRVRVTDGRLIITTRGLAPGAAPAPGTGGRVGACDHVYELAAATSSLNRMERPTGDEHGVGADSRLLLGGVASWNCQVDQESERLSVALTSSSGETARRAYRWRR